MKRTFICVLILSLAVPATASALNDKNKVGGGPITFTPKNMKSVVFSHELHVSQKGLRCAGCHQAVLMAQGSYHVDKSLITKDGFCAKCHNGQKSFDVHDEKNCVRCHK